MKPLLASTMGWTDSLVAVPVWLLGVFWAVILTALGALVLVRLRRRGKVEIEVPTITKAEIFGLQWRWNFRQGEVCDVVCFCPKCSREVKPRSETRHGFLQLISYACECRKWRSRSFQCSQAQMMERVSRVIEEKTKPALGRASRPANIRIVPRSRGSTASG